MKTLNRILGSQFQVWVQKDKGDEWLPTTSVGNNKEAMERTGETLKEIEGWHKVKVEPLALATNPKEVVSAKKKEKWMIQDWAGNEMFNGKTFKSFEDADEYLSLWIEKKYPKTKDDEDAFSEERGEFEVVQVEASLNEFPVLSKIVTADIEDDFQVSWLKNPLSEEKFLEISKYYKGWRKAVIRWFDKLSGEGQVRMAEGPLKGMSIYVHGSAFGGDPNFGQGTQFVPENNMEVMVKLFIDTTYIQVSEMKQAKAQKPNAEPKVESAAKTPSALIQISIYKTVQKDSIDNGVSIEPSGISDTEIEVKKLFKTWEDMLKHLNNELDLPLDKKEYMAFEDGRLEYNRNEDEHGNVLPTLQDQKIAEERKQLYLADYSIYVKYVTPEVPTVQDLIAEGFQEY